ncbi:MAG: HD domain-containing protein [Desulfobacterales bacterium]|jgi:tRNA nucleotidyltransferase/poly(A) polymerase
MILIDTNIFPEIPGAFIVGGSIRDMLCGRSPVDYDVAVQGDPVKFARQIESRTHGRRVEIGKAGRRIIRVVSENKIVDISKIKEESIEKDLQARDFTINAMAYDLSSHRLIDLVGSQRDLKNKTIRMVSTDSFNRDPVRLLRAYRIAAEFQFQIEAQTQAAIKEQALLIQKSAGERIREEFFKMLQCAGSHPYLCQMADTGLLFAFLPELSALKECRQDQYHQFNVFEHTLRAFSQMEGLLGSNQKLLVAKGEPASRRITDAQIPLLKFSILLHDVAKPAVQTMDTDGKLHFYGHERRSAQMAEVICRRLKCSTRNIDRIVFLVRHHTRPLFLFTALNAQNETSRAVTRFFIKCAAHIPELLMCATADMLGKEKELNDRNRAFIQFVNQLLADFETDFKPKKSKTPIITGRDLIHEFGLKPSPRFKKILDRVEEERLSRSDMTRKDALALVKKLIETEVRGQNSENR